MTDHITNTNVGNIEYISKQDAIDAIHCDITITGRENAETVCKAIASFTDGIKAIEPADVVPVVHGKWIGYDDTERFTAQCSLCGNVVDTRFGSNFCPNCGADMRGEQE